MEAGGGVKRKPIRHSVRKRVLESHEGRCAICGDRPEWPERLTIDHVRPVSLGGTNEESNLQPACAPCNSAKGNGRRQEPRVKRPPAAPNTIEGGMRQAAQRLREWIAPESLP